MDSNRKTTMTALLVLLVTGAVPVPVAADVTVSPTCGDDGQSFEITVTVVNDFRDHDPTGYHFSIFEDWVGHCTSGDGLYSPEVPHMPLPPYGSQASWTFTVPAFTRDRMFLYSPVLWLASGYGTQNPSEHFVSGAAACGNGTAVRGYLRDSGDGLFHVQACVADCGSWLCYDRIDLTGLDISTYEAHVGTDLPIDIEGYQPGAGSPGGVCLVATALQPSPGGECRPVPDQGLSWGALKSAYR